MIVIAPKYQLGQRVVFNRFGFAAYFKEDVEQVGTIDSILINHKFKCYMEGKEFVRTKEPETIIQYYTEHDDEVPEAAILGIAAAVPPPPPNMEMHFG